MKTSMQSLGWLVLLFAFAAPAPASMLVTPGPGPTLDAPADDHRVARRKKRRRGKKKRKKTAKEEASASEKAATTETAPPEPVPLPSPPAPAADEAAPLPIEPTDVVPAAAEPIAPELSADPTAELLEAASATHATAAGRMETIEASPVQATVNTAAPPGATEGGRVERQPVFPLTFAVELGVGFPQLVTDLRTTFIPHLEVGYLLPWFEQRLNVLASVSYVYPDQRSVVTDSRFTNGGDFQYRIKEEEIVTSVGGLYRVFAPRAWLNFYAQAGLQVRWQRSEVRGNANGEPLGINHETKTAVGGVLAGGVELLLGPGAIAAELGFALSDLDHTVTGETSSGGLTFQVGYHFLF